MLLIQCIEVIHNNDSEYLSPTRYIKNIILSDFIGVYADLAHILLESNACNNCIIKVLYNELIFFDWQLMVYNTNIF
jgi:hypothetical protein